MTRPLRVLILEDSEDDALLILRHLRAAGFEPDHARVDTPDGFRAALSEREWDIILSDYTMPRFKAPDALSLLRETGKDIPFIVVSGSIGEETAVEIMKAGAADYVMKERIRRLGPAVAREVREAGIRRDARILEARYLRAQRMESIGALAGGIAHDLNNLLSPITMVAEMMRLSLREPRDLRLLDTLCSSAERGAELVKQILSFIRGMEEERTVLSAGELVSETAKMLRSSMPKSITLRTNVDPDAWNVTGNSTQLFQVLMNLCVNAKDAMPAGGTLTLSARNETVDPTPAESNPGAHPGKFTVFTVEDTGTGIPPEILGKIFDSSFTTKEPGKGTGLGLATVQSIVRSHNGFVTVESRPGRGSAFHVHLPALPAVLHAPEEPKMEEAPQGHGELVLVVDDEAAIRGLARAALTSFGYRVATADNGEEGVTLFRSKREEARAVILDMLMPVLDGPGAACALREIAPEIPIILATGVASTEAEEYLARGLVQAILLKPFPMATLLHTLDRVLHPPL